MQVVYQALERDMSTIPPSIALPRFLDSGDRGLTVELGDTVDPSISEQVVALDRALQARSLAGVIETIPTYRSLLVIFDPTRIRKLALKEEIVALWPPTRTADQAQRLWRVPVAYGGEHGVDLEAVARTHDISRDEVVRLHSGPVYRVHMIGFAPGFAYLGGLPEVLHTSRRTDPRLKTPASSISIGGKQAAVSPPLEVPSGWHLIGRTPIRSYDPRCVENPFLFSAGDTIRFVPISHAEFDAMSSAVAAGQRLIRPEVVDV
jgi:5-oxoprolinase (ATP-hydrolysing) subunit B